jgi:hypothetical protein
MVPDLYPPEDAMPRGSLDLGDGYALLRAREGTARIVDGVPGATIQAYFASKGEDLEIVSVQRWARLALPSGQIARSAWKEETMERLRMSRNVKVLFIFLVLFFIH